MNCQVKFVDTQAPTLIDGAVNPTGAVSVVNFKGKTVGVVPLEDGPSMVLAEVVPDEEWELGKKATFLPFGGGSGCPEDTKQIVRVTWNGGITKPGGKEVHATS